MPNSNEVDPLSDVLAQIPLVAAFARFVSASRVTGGISKRTDALKVTVTVDAQAVSAAAVKYWDESNFSPEVMGWVRKSVEFQAVAAPNWEPLSVTVPPELTVGDPR